MMVASQTCLPRSKYIGTKWLNEGLFPAIEPDEYFKKTARPKRTITVTKNDNYQTINNVEKKFKNNTKCFEISASKTTRYSNSFS